MWKTNNYNGEQVWYSEEEYNEALNTVERIKDSLKFALHSNSGDNFFGGVDNAYEIANNFLKNFNKNVNNDFTNQKPRNHG